MVTFFLFYTKKEKFVAPVGTPVRVHHRVWGNELQNHLIKRHSLDSGKLSFLEF